MLHDYRGKTFTEEAIGAAGCDSCCSLTIMGKKWFQDYKARLMPEMYREISGPHQSDMMFTFGNGGKLQSLRKYVLPVEMHGYSSRLCVELVPSDIPLLLSKDTMMKAAMVLDFANLKISVFGVERNMKENRVGHPIISVLPKRRQPFQNEVLLAEGSWEEVLVNQIIPRKGQKISREQQKAIINKVHLQTGHWSTEKMAKFLKQSRA